MPRLVHQNPKYRHHRPSGQALVTIAGRDIYLGAYGTRASHDSYDRVIGEWLSNGRRLDSGGACDLHLAEVIAAYWEHVQRYYRKPDGTPTSEVETIRQALRPLNRLYGATRVAHFGPLALKAVRAEMLKPREVLHPTTRRNHLTAGWCRSYTNKQVNRLRGMFRWAAENELIPASVYHGLRAVTGLKKGRSDAREAEPVRPVPETDIDAVLPHLSAQVQAMIGLQRITGMRPGEVCAMRACDIDMSGELWVYRPPEHKTQHHGHAREIYLGANCRRILEPFLKPDVRAFLFSPTDAVAEQRRRAARARTTPLSCGNRPGSNRRERPRRTLGDCYSVAAYRRAIARACAAAGVPRWHPHQIRHTAGTRFRRTHGLEAAQILLGHKTLTATQVYAEQNVAAAQEIMLEMG